MNRVFKGSLGLCLIAALLLYFIGVGFNMAHTFDAGSPTSSAGGGGNQSPGKNPPSTGNTNGGSGGTGGKRQGTVTGMKDDHGISYDRLSEQGQKCYDDMLKGLTDHEDLFEVASVSDEEMSQVFSEVIRDHPEIFWVRKHAYTTGGDGRTTDSPAYDYSVSEVKDLQQKVDKVVDAIFNAIPDTASTYDKVKAFYEWIINNTDYEIGTRNDQNMVGVFVDNKAVCAGYSSAFQYLCQKAGIPCECITGTVRNGEPHAWNLVCIEGTWTYVDVTWGDPVFIEEDGTKGSGEMNYHYFCVTTEEIEREHVAKEPSGGLPECKSRKYDYYARNNAMYDMFDVNEFNAAISQKMSAGENHLSAKYNSKEAYAAALAYVSSPDVYTGPLSSAKGLTFANENEVLVFDLKWI